MKKERVIELLKFQFKKNGFTEKEVKTLGIKKLVEKKGKKYYLKQSIRKRVKVVLTGGFFDVIHIGHIKTLKKAKSYGDMLVVVVARDDMIKRKGRALVHNQKERAELVSSIKFVDLAIKGGKEPIRIFERIKPDVIVYGYDQKVFLKPKGCRIVKLRTKYKPNRIKTTKIIKNY